MSSMSPAVPHLLLVEDDPSLGYLLREYLQLKDLSVNWVDRGSLALEAIRQQRPDLVVLDVMLPDKDGFQLANELKAEFPGLPFLFLSARALKTDVLKGFHLGAEDYVKKPVDEEELLMRIQAILRRSLGAGGQPQEGIVLGKYHFLPQKQEIWLGETVQKLSRRESELLGSLAEAGGELIESQDLLNKFWGKDDYFARKSMDVYLHKLRKLLADDPSLKIVNVHGRGYFLEGI